MRDFDLVVHDHNGEDSLYINFETRKATLSWVGEAGSGTCCDVVDAVGKVFEAYGDNLKSIVGQLKDELDKENEDGGKVLELLDRLAEMREKWMLNDTAEELKTWEDVLIEDVSIEKETENVKALRQEQ